MAFIDQAKTDAKAVKKKERDRLKAERTASRDTSEDTRPEEETQPKSHVDNPEGEVVDTPETSEPVIDDAGMSNEKANEEAEKEVSKTKKSSK